MHTYPGTASHFTWSKIKALRTRMHTSRMRTVRSLTVSRSIGGGLPNRSPQMQTPGWMHSPDADPPGCRPPQMQTLLDADPQCRPLRYRPPGCRPPRMQSFPSIGQSPGCSPPPRFRPLLDADPPWCRSLPPVDRRNDTRLWKYYLAPNFVCGR